MFGHKPKIFGSNGGFERLLLRQDGSKELSRRHQLCPGRIYSHSSKADTTSVPTGVSCFLAFLRFVPFFGTCTRFINTFCFRFVDVWIPRTMYHLSVTDTDAYYFTIARDTLEECVPVHLKTEFNKCKHTWIADESKPESKLVPLVYKIECNSSHSVSFIVLLLFLHKCSFAGIANGIVALSPKLYCAFQEVTPAVTTLVREIQNQGEPYVGSLTEVVNDKLKLSHKGISKRSNKFTALQFLDALRMKGGSQLSAVNHIFLYKNHRLYQTRLTKKSIEAFFTKRYLLDCNIRTKHYE